MVSLLAAGPVADDKVGALADGIPNWAGVEGDVVPHLLFVPLREAHIMNLEITP
jgi:hypothetical protein